MPTKDEEDAAFNVIEGKLHALIGQVPQIPFIDLPGRVREFLDSVGGRAQVRSAVHAGLQAAEDVRNKAKTTDMVVTNRPADAGETKW